MDLAGLLEKYKIDRDDKKEITEKYKKGIEDILRSRFNQEGTSVSLKYGGSLSKGTASSLDCDIDILCYVNADSDLSVEEIYNAAEEELSDNGYNIQPKNSAIKVTGKLNYDDWEMTIDVVPGKYFTDDDNNDDVWLWQNRDHCRLKSNPVKQISKVQNSSSREIIRLIKLYRHFNNFPFKSFFLENFCIDIVEPEFKENDDLQDKLIKFCKHWEEIGITKIKDPANPNNDIMHIHSQEEFETIRNKIHDLLEALLTDDQDTYINCLCGKPYDIEEGYRKNAFSHSTFNNRMLGNRITLINQNTGAVIDEDAPIDKDVSLEFQYPIQSYQDVDVKWIVSNGGYEARKANQKRGEMVESNKKITFQTFPTFIRKEHTSYYGNHFVQAVVRYGNKIVEHSQIRKVKVR